MDKSYDRSGSGHSSDVSTPMVRVFVGSDQHEFKLHKKLLCVASDYFQDRLEATPGDLASSSLHRDGTLKRDQATTSGTVIWLPTESPATFELFVVWLYRPRSFRSFINAAIAEAAPRPRRAPSTSSPPLPSATSPQAPHSPEHRLAQLHWDLVRLHLFAASIGAFSLQDAAMDALQDLYLRRDWTVSPRLVAFLYSPSTSPEDGRALRLRRWAVAMIAWGAANANAIVAGGGDDGRYRRVLDAHPAARADFAAHLARLRGGTGELCMKNPQLRLPGNRLRGAERALGFRMCSFHSHRAAVGEGSCPHLEERPAVYAAPERQARSFWRWGSGGEESGASDESEATEG